MARQFCQMESLKTTYQNTISLELEFFAEPFWKYFSLKISNLNFKNTWPLKNILRTLGDVKSNFGQLLFSTSNWFFHSYFSLWKKALNIFFQIFSETFKALKLKQEWKNQLGVENKSGSKVDFTSPKVLKIFFSGKIFLIFKFPIFKPQYLQKDHFSEFLAY